MATRQGGGVAKACKPIRSKEFNTRAAGTFEVTATVRIGIRLAGDV